VDAARGDAHRSTPRCAVCDNHPEGSRAIQHVRPPAEVRMGASNLDLSEQGPSRSAVEGCGGRSVRQNPQEVEEPSKTCIRGTRSALANSPDRTVSSRTTSGSITSKAASMRWTHHVVLADAAFTFLQIKRARRPDAPRPMLPIVRGWGHEGLDPLYIPHHLSLNGVQTQGHAG